MRCIVVNFLKRLSIASVLNPIKSNSRIGIDRMSAIATEHNIAEQRGQFWTDLNRRNYTESSP